MSQVPWPPGNTSASPTVPDSPCVLHSSVPNRSPFQAIQLATHTPLSPPLASQTMAQTIYDLSIHVQGLSRSYPTISCSVRRERCLLSNLTRANRCRNLPKMTLLQPKCIFFCVFLKFGGYGFCMVVLPVQTPPFLLYGGCEHLISLLVIFGKLMGWLVSRKIGRQPGGFLKVKVSVVGFGLLMPIRVWCAGSSPLDDGWMLRL